MGAETPLDKIKALVASRKLTAVTQPAPENVQRLQILADKAPLQGLHATKEIYINDAPGRDKLIRAQFHDKLLQEADVSVKMRGEYVAPGSQPPPGTKKLHLFVTGASEDAVAKAERIVQEAIQQAAAPRPPQPPTVPPNPLGISPLPSGMAFRPPPGLPGVPCGPGGPGPVGGLNGPGPSMSQPRHKMVNPATLPEEWELPGDLPLPRGENSRTVTQQGQSFSQAKIFLDMDPRPGFNVKAKIEGENRAHLNHVQGLTGAKVYLRGRGSGYIEPVSGKVAFERMYLYISHPEEKCSRLAVDLCKDLVAVVQNDYATDFGRTDKQQAWHVPMHLRKLIESNSTITAYPAQLGLVHKSTRDEDAKDNGDDDLTADEAATDIKRRKFTESP